MDSAPLALTPS